MQIDIAAHRFDLHIIRGQLGIEIATDTRHLHGPGYALHVLVRADGTGLKAAAGRNGDRQRRFAVAVVTRGLRQHHAHDNRAGVIDDIHALDAAAERAGDMHVGLRAADHLDGARYVDHAHRIARRRRDSLVELRRRAGGRAPSC